MRGDSNRALGEARRRELLAFFGRYVGEHGYPPTIREAGKAMSMEPSGVHRHFARLVEDGQLRRVQVSAGRTRYELA